MRTSSRSRGGVSAFAWISSAWLVGFTVATCALACTTELPSAKGSPNVPVTRAIAQAAASTAGTAKAPSAPPDAGAPAAKAAVDPLFDKLLNVQKATAPRAISGGEFFFLSDASGTAQLFRQSSLEPTDNGSVAPTRPAEGVTSFSDRVSSYRVAPDGTFAVVLRDTGGDENDQILKVGFGGKTPTISALTDAPKVKHTLPVVDDASKRVAFTSNARNGKDMDLYVEDTSADSKTFGKKPFVELSGSFVVADWRGDTLLVVESRSNVDDDLWIVDTKTKKKTLLTKHTGDERYDGAAFSADGANVFVLTDRGGEFMHLASVDAKTGKQKTVLEGTHDFTHLAVPRPDATKGASKAALVVSENVDGVENPSVLTLDATGAVKKRTPTTLRGVVGGVDVAPSGTVAYVSFEKANQPAEIFRIDTANAKSARVTTSGHAGVDETKLVGAELLTVPTSDKKTVSTFWYPPANADGPAPAVLLVHGGPESQAQPNFNPIVQYLVAKGYGVATPNVRGSLGYGKSFAHLDDKAKREDSVRDLSEIGKFLAERPEVDRTRMVLMGGSYGGYMVLAGLTLYPEQWAAGVDIVGIANFRTFLEQTAPYRRALREAEYGSLATDGALLDRISPLHKVDKIKAPLFVVHGTRDPRVPVGEARQIHDALKARGLPVELLTFDDEGHGLAKRKNRLVAYPALARFLETHVPPKKPVAPAK
ncbi:MAG: S9 family peptidase [Polyangiaceae bacterium]